MYRFFKNLVAVLQRCSSFSLHPDNQVFNCNLNCNPATRNELLYEDFWRKVLRNIILTLRNLYFSYTKCIKSQMFALYLTLFN